MPYPLSCLSAWCQSTNHFLSTPQYATITSTYTDTVTGLCATQTPYIGGYELGSSTANFTVVKGVGNNAYDCCFNCNFIPYTDNCAAWISSPGDCLFIQGPFSYLGPPCPSGTGNGAVHVKPTAHPNNLGGPGRCAGSITVCSG